MAVAKTILNLLTRNAIEHSVVRHPYSENSDATAQAAHLSGERLAKAVVLKDNRGYVLAVIPATHVVETGTLSQKIRRPLVMATEAEATRLFPDCEMGAIPVLGKAYGLPNAVDNKLAELPEIFFEAGDHKSLIKVNAANFQRLMEGAVFANFSHHKG